MSEHEHEEGGSAFPCEGGPGSGLVADPGMSLRDYFAAKALTLGAGVWPGGSIPHNAKGIAEKCYAVADAMLASRRLAAPLSSRTIPVSMGVEQAEREDYRDLCRVIHKHGDSRGLDPLASIDEVDAWLDRVCRDRDALWKSLLTIIEDCPDLVAAKFARDMATQTQGEPLCPDEASSTAPSS